MKKLNKILAMLLCAVMIIGVIPFAVKNSNDVAAAEDGGVVQEEGDAVVVLTADLANTDFRNIHNRFKSNYITVNSKMYGVDAVENGIPFNRIIFVFGANVSLGSSDTAFDYSTALTGDEVIVYTNKCTITNTDVWEVGSTVGTLKKSDKTGLINYYDGDTTCELAFSTGESKFTRIACDVTFDYLNLHFPAINPIIYCHGFNFTVTENVNFTYADASKVGYRPIVVNGYASSTSYSSEAGATQTITLNGGEYQYVSPRVRMTDANTTISGKTINLNFGKVRIVKDSGITDPNMTAFVAYDNFSNVEVNVVVDGAIFEGDVCLFGGKQTSGTSPTASTVSNTTINLHIKNGTFRKGILPYLENYINDSNVQVITGCAFSEKVNVNVTVDSVILGTDTDIRAESIEDEANITSTLCCDEAFEPTYAGYFLGFDRYYTLDESQSQRVECGSGESSLVYVNVKDPADTKTIKRNCAEHNYAPHIGENYRPYYLCTYCKNDAGLTWDNYESPMLYVTGDNGSIFNSGINEENGVDTIERASELIAEWSMGGTAVNCATLLKPGEEVWKYNSNVLTVTSKDENCKVQFQGFVNFEGDVRFSGLYLAATSEAKTFFLNYNNFTVESNCEQAATTGGYKLAVVAGARANSEASKAKYATNKKEIDQKIDLQSLNWCTVFAGTTSANAGKIYYASNKDYSVDCEGYVNINVGGTANVANVDLVTNEGIFAKVVLPIEKEVTIKNNHDTSTAIQFTLADCADGKTTVYGNFTTTEGDVTGSEEHVYKYDFDAFTYVGMSLKAKDEDGYYGMRASFRVSKDVDESVVEFGTILYNEWNANRFRYFRGATYYGGTGTSDALGTTDKIAKSVAYLKNAEGKAAIANYELGAEDDAAIFRATVEFDDDDMIVSFDYLPINFVPYGVVNDENGWYTVIGDSYGDTLRNFAMSISEDENATEADKQKAESIIDHINSLLPVE